MRIFPIAVLLALYSPLALCQQTSSPQSTRCEFAGGKSATINYFSDRMDGRTIFGGAVPYGQVWQTGGSKPTTLTTQTNVILGGKEIPAGVYRLKTIPSPDSWTLFLVRVAGKPEDASARAPSEQASINLFVRHMATPIERFSIMFDQKRGGCVLNFRWENTEASALIAEGK